MGIVLDHFVGWSGLYVVLSPPLTRWQEVVRSHEEVPGSTHTGAAAGSVGCSKWWSNWMDSGISHGIPWYWTPESCDFSQKIPFWQGEFSCCLLLNYLKSSRPAIPKWLHTHSHWWYGPHCWHIAVPTLLVYIWWLSYLSDRPSSWLHCHCWFQTFCLQICGFVQI